MAKKRIVAILTALFMMISISHVSLAFTGPILDDGDRIDKIGDYYVMDDGEIQVNKVGVSISGSGRRTDMTRSTSIDRIKPADATDRPFIYAGLCKKTGCCSLGCDTDEGDPPCVFTCNDPCTGDSQILTTPKYEASTCIGVGGADAYMYQQNSEPTIVVPDFRIPVKAGDILKVRDLPAEQDRTELIYSTTADSVKRRICINKDGEESDDTIQNPPTDSSISVSSSNPFKNVRLIYLEPWTDGGFVYPQSIRVLTDSKVNDAAVNFGRGESASWACTLAYCDSRGSFEPHVIMIPNNWAVREDYGVRDFYLNTQLLTSLADRFRLCAVLGCDYLAQEKCNNKDDNCDGVVDGAAVDGDLCQCTDGDTQGCSSNIGVCTAGTETCVDGEWAGCTGIVPSTEICGDSLDNDCDGVVDYDDVEDCACPDSDGDYFSDMGGQWPICGTIDCDDDNPFAYPGGTEACDGADNDCNEEIDETCAEKYDQTASTTGTCLKEQCYYYDGYTGLCVDDGNYTMDYYCSNGEWNTRTSLVALNLIELVGSSDYTLFCGDPNEAVNDMQYFILSAKYDASRYVFGDTVAVGLPPDCGMGPCINNICALSYEGGEKVAFGTSVNLPINSSENQDQSFLRLFKESQQTYSSDGHYDYCDGVIKSQEGKYLGCSRNDVIEGKGAKIWYDAKKASLIYSPENIVVGEMSFTTTLAGLFSNPLRTIRDLVLPGDLESGNFIETSVFDKMYINKVGDKAVRGTVNNDLGRMAIVYDNIYANICAVTKAVVDKMCIDECITCGLKIVGGRPVFYVESDEPFAFMPLWPDMTAKMRLTEDLGEFEAAEIIQSIAGSQAEWQGETGIPAQFTLELLEGYDATKVFSYLWDFGDGVTFSTDNLQQAENILHPYLKQDAYDYTLRVFDNNFRMDEKTGVIIIEGFDDGEQCIINDQCNSEFCTPEEPRTCQESTCSDSYKGPEETDVDCGGVCVREGSKCDAGQECSVGSDCITEECVNGICSAPLLRCSVKTGGCAADETLMLKMNDESNAHAELPIQNNYGYSLCCGVKKDTITTACDANSAVALKTSAATNAHVSQGNVAGYDNPVCVSALNNKMSCAYRTSCEEIGGECVASISASTNAHIGDCTSYPLKICCGFGVFTADVCGNDVLEAGEECEDGNTDEGDGCSLTCKIECPDGNIDGTEGCDDGNDVDD